MSQKTESLLMTIPQAAQSLRVSVGTIWNLFNSGDLPYVKIGGSRRVHVDEVRRIASRGASTKVTA
jgi:excisionase family DNA binding protein